MYPRAGDPSAAGPSSERSHTPPAGRIVAATFPGPPELFKKNIGMFLPDYDYSGLGASLHRIVRRILQMKHAIDHLVIERLECQQRLSRAYLDCRLESGPDPRSCGYIILRRMVNILNGIFSKYPASVD